ncbi:MAG: dTDP-4-dehydrorhamnose 3,5-epimerase [uncultured Solirubrobacteraceae bacterium]|uniref:dTDP-4-dehydrorhamnose 3,5-epimerase n=1 Tax=uncultured Solirubrobacteraceae bacterium TaxID=1162706 RepID=A0A6J4TRB9_9ACTN|nr:MAG: dTDP-4-dehydrorhamnose 3,5-epimerase [uncultured Solirubrobacteraceae bacterium]
MKLIETRLQGPILLEPAAHGDARGFFLESYRANVWAEHGVGDVFVQDNHSRSRRGVLRGMHFAVGAGQAKLVRCARGAILDIVVDIRRDSPTWMEWEAHVLDDEHARQLYIPIGFAHGFCVLSDVADVTYKCSTYYDPELERGFRHNDPDVAIDWPQDMELIVSQRDLEAPLLREIYDTLPF